MKSGAIPVLVLVIIFLVTTGCGGGGGDGDGHGNLVVGNITGPASVDEGTSVNFTVTASGDTGIKYQWACDPSTAGTFTNQAATTTFHAGEVAADILITIRVSVSSDHSGAQLKSVDVVLRDQRFTGWTRTCGGTGFDAGYGVGVDSGGNAYVTGVFMGTVDFDPGQGVVRTSHGGYDAFLSKYDVSGNLVWVRTWGGTLWDQGFSITLDAFDGVYIAGWFQGVSDFDPGAGVDWHTANGDLDAFISKFDTNGNFLWAHTWGGPYWDKAQGVAVHWSGAVYVTGYYEGLTDFNPTDAVDRHYSINGRDVFLCKYNRDGGYMWARVWDGTEGQGVACDQNGNVYVTGSYAGSADFNPGSGIDWHVSNGDPDAFLSKFESSGAFQWARTWGGPHGDEGRQVIIDYFGRVYVTGYFTYWVDFDPGDGGVWIQSLPTVSGGPSQDVFLSKFDTAGEFKWVRAWGGNDEDAADRLALDGSNDICVAGRFFNTVDFDPAGGVDNITSNGDRDIFMSKFDTSGDYKWSFTLGGLDGEAAWGVAIDESDRIYLTGLYHSTVDFDPGLGIDNRTSNGEADIFVTQLRP